MDAAKKAHIGLLTSRSGDRPHFDDLRGLVPAEVGLTIESVGVGPEATVDTRTEAVLRRATNGARGFRSAACHARSGNPTGTPQTPNRLGTPDALRWPGAPALEGGA